MQCNTLTCHYATRQAQPWLGKWKWPLALHVTVTQYVARVTQFIGNVHYLYTAEYAGKCFLKLISGPRHQGSAALNPSTSV